MAEETHVHHHNDDKPTVSLRVAHTTRGDTWEVEVKGTPTPAQAVAMFSDTRAKLEAQLTPERGAE